MDDRELTRALAALAAEHDPAEHDVAQIRGTFTLRRRRRRAVTGTVIGVLVLVAGLILVTRTLAGDHKPAPVATPEPGKWIQYTVTGLGVAQSAFLSSVAAVSDTDVWAVGSQDDPARRGKQQTNLAVHWDGQRWQQVDIPSGAGLSRVAAIAADDVWAVGTGQPGSGGFAAHWDGHAWRQVPSPTPNGTPAGTPITLSGIAARAANDVWAVGCAAYERQGSPIIQHWNGHAWQSSPLPAAVKCVTGVSIVSANDVWAVGTASPDQHNTTPLALHWNGRQWSAVPVAGPFGAANVGGFDNVIALSATDVWAFGGYVEFAQHWDGQKWTHVPGPSNSDFEGTAEAPNGRRGLVTSTLPTDGRKNPNLFSFNGATWTNQPGPPLTGSAIEGQIAGFSVAHGSNRLWAVGLYSGPTVKESPLIALTIAP